MTKPHTTLFISDLHLMQSGPKVTQLFFDFCTEIASKSDALYILGDFFEYWVGDDDHNQFKQTKTTTTLNHNHRGRNSLLNKIYVSDTSHYSKTKG